VTPDETSKVPRARLSQIAARKLQALGITHAFGASKESITGELPLAPGGLKHPATGATLTQLPFVVVGHDRLVGTEPPLSALGPISFYDADSAAAVAERVAQAFAQRLSQLKAVAEQMRGFRIEPKLDVDRLLVHGQVQTSAYRFEVWGSPEGVRVARVLPQSGSPFDMDPSVGQLELASFKTTADLEAHLSASVPKWQEMQSRPTEGKAEPDSTLKLHAPSANALTAGALARFGEGAVVTYGAKLEVTQEFDVSGTRYKFTAVHERASTFMGKVVGPGGEKWSERIDCQRFGGVQALLTSLFNLQPPAAPTRPGREEKPAAGPTAPAQLQPQVGEVWVMNVLVEQESNGEVRYVGTNTEGKPYGAPRILKRTDFESIFTQVKDGWRLRIHIDVVQGDVVSYRQLDSKGNAVGAARNIAAPVLTTTFIPESKEP
jgi:hypothetical protein